LLPVCQPFAGGCCCHCLLFVWLVVGCLLTFVVICGSGSRLSLLVAVVFAPQLGAISPTHTSPRSDPQVPPASPSPSPPHHALDIGSRCRKAAMLSCPSHPTATSLVRIVPRSLRTCPSITSHHTTTTIIVTSPQPQQV
jgi:hypothetical protein